MSNFSSMHCASLNELDKPRQFNQQTASNWFHLSLFKLYCMTRSCYIFYCLCLLYLFRTKSSCRINNTKMFLYHDFHLHWQIARPVAFYSDCSASNSSQAASSLQRRSNSTWWCSLVDKNKAIAKLIALTTNSRQGKVPNLSENNTKHC